VEGAGGAGAEGCGGFEQGGVDGAESGDKRLHRKRQAIQDGADEQAGEGEGEWMSEEADEEAAGLGERA
jgi:hypothetical protein